MSVYSSLLGDGQCANELDQWEPHEMFSVQPVRRLYNATLVVFGNQFQMRSEYNDSFSSVTSE
jgi:hypothetical protein